MAASDRSTANLAAEFFVASSLWRKGFSVTITLGNTKEVDLVVTLEPGKVRTIDVKGLKNKTNWPLGRPDHLRQDKDHLFVFVSFLNRFADATVPPDVFVVPSTQIDNLRVPWSSGSPDLCCVTYSRVKGSRFENAWDLIGSS